MRQYQTFKQLVIGLVAVVVVIVATWALIEAEPRAEEQVYDLEWEQVGPNTWRLIDPRTKVACYRMDYDSQMACAPLQVRLGLK